MKRVAGILFFALMASAFAVSDEEVTARKVALELAGAFSNDGYKMRDGHWSGALRTGETHLIQVNLYAGNQYWFSVGATAGAKKLAVEIFDESGKPVTSDPFQDGAKAAAGFAPEASGAYYIRIQELDGEPANFCLIYSYK